MFGYIDVIVTMTFIILERAPRELAHFGSWGWGAGGHMRKVFPLVLG